MRLFIASHFSEQVKKLLLDCMAQLKVQTRAASLTRPENLHLTLVFIGESDQTASIQDVIDEVVPKRPFEISVGGVGRFDDLWWVGIENSPALTDLVRQLQDSLRSRGFLIEQRDFKPHITIARRVFADAPVKLEIPTTTMLVDHISLMKSERISGRLTYGELYRGEIS